MGESYLIDGLKKHTFAMLCLYSLFTFYTMHKLDYHHGTNAFQSLSNPA